MTNLRYFEFTPVEKKLIDEEEREMYLAGERVKLTVEKREQKEQKKVLRKIILINGRAEFASN